MVVRGNRLLMLASALLLLVAIAHTFGVFAEAPPGDQAAQAVVAAMRAYEIDMGLGMHPSIYDVQEGLGLTMTLFVLFLVATNVVAMTEAAAVSGLRPKLILAVTIANWALVVLYWIYRIPPPLISFTLTGGLMTVVWIRARRS